LDFFSIPVLKYIQIRKTQTNVTPTAKDKREVIKKAAKTQPERDISEKRV
jgi:hypothetical protein